METVLSSNHWEESCTASHIMSVFRASKKLDYTHWENFHSPSRFAHIILKLEINEIVRVFTIKLKFALWVLEIYSLSLIRNMQKQRSERMLSKNSHVCWLMIALRHVSNYLLFQNCEYCYREADIWCVSKEKTFPLPFPPTSIKFQTFCGPPYNTIPYKP